MYCLKYTHKLPLSLDKSWDFFSNPKNLKLLTPPHMGFEITNDIEGKMYAGQIISYIIRPLLNIPMTWVTEIAHVQAPHYFIDEQRFGPYTFWHHEHRFREIENGVEMTDTIYYKLPLGPLGKILHAVKVKSDLESIFTFRKNVLDKMFGVYQNLS